MTAPEDRAGTADAAAPASRPGGTTDAFIRHVAHDLRASLNAVVGWAEVVKAGQSSPEDLQRAGDTIVRHVRHLSQRLNDALDLWRLDVGLLEVSPRPASVSAALRAAVDQAAPQFESRRVACVCSDVEEGMATVDMPRLVQALVALLADAAANTPTGDRVEARVSREGDELVVRITGGGRVPEAGAFERSPAHTRPDPAARPFAFGLALASILVRRNGGTLAAEPAGDARVAFVVRLSAAPASP